MAKSNDPEITALTEQLRDLEAQREAIEARLATLSQVPPSEPYSVPPRPAKDRSPQEKVDLFRKLFAGRPDVFALRWDNTKDGRSGYAPACSNEWASGFAANRRLSAVRVRIKHSFRCQTKSSSVICADTSLVAIAAIRDGRLSSA